MQSSQRHHLYATSLSCFSNLCISYVLFLSLSLLRFILAPHFAFLSHRSYLFLTLLCFSLVFFFVPFYFHVFLSLSLSSPSPSMFPPPTPPCPFLSFLFHLSFFLLFPPFRKPPPRLRTSPSPPLPPPPPFCLLCCFLLVRGERAGAVDP